MNTSWIQRKDFSVKVRKGISHHYWLNNNNGNALYISAFHYVVHIKVWTKLNARLKHVMTFFLTIEITNISSTLN